MIIQEIVLTICSQITNTTMMRVGARNFCYGHINNNAYLMFKVRGCNAMAGGRLRISYNAGADDYTVELFRVRGIETKTICQYDGIYCDMLSEVIERMVG